MIYSFKLKQGNLRYDESIFSDSSGRKTFFGGIRINSLGRERIPFEMNIRSTRGVQIRLKCFKYSPPPPSFGPCPEAGEINLPRQLQQNGEAFFHLNSPNRNLGDSMKVYSLNIFDFESIYSLIIEIV